MAPTRTSTSPATDLVATTHGWANRLLIALLTGTGGKRLGRRLAVVEYRGRRTGPPHRLVVRYVAQQATVRIDVGRPDRTSWWHTFETPSPVRLRLAGADHDGLAHLERDGDRVAVVAELEHAAAPGRSTEPEQIPDAVADATPARSGDGPGGTAVRLSLSTAAVAVVAAVWTFADPGLLHGPAAMQGSARGTALVLGSIAVPTLLGSLRSASRGSGSALLVAAGALAYIVYNAVLLLFLTPFNAAFLVYVALLGLALWSLGYLAATPEVWRAGQSIADRAPVRGISTYVWVVAALNTTAWLASIVPSLGRYPTPLLEGTGVQTNAVYVQDLAIWLPLAAVAALWLRRREARGAVVVATVLGLWVIEGASIAVDQWFGVRADPGSPVVSLTLVAPFLAVAAVGLVPLWLMLRRPTRA